MKMQIKIEQEHTDGREEDAKQEGIRIGLEKAIEIVDNLYAQLPTHKVWGLSADDVCDNCENLIKNKLKSALSENEKK